MNWIATQAGFEWVITDDADRNVFAWMRKGNDARARCLVVVNFSPECLSRLSRPRALCRQVARGLQFAIPRIMAAAMSAMSGEVRTMGRLCPSSA